MSLSELLPLSQDNRSTTSEGEVIDPAEHYLRLFAEDSDSANKYLETFIEDSLKRLTIYASAIHIRTSLTLMRSEGKVDEDKIARLLEEYNDLFHSYLERESIEPVEPTPERSRIRSLVDKIIRR